MKAGLAIVAVYLGLIAVLALVQPEALREAYRAGYDPTLARLCEWMDRPVCSTITQQEEE